MILLFKNKGFVAWWIRMATLSQYSHAAWMKGNPTLRNKLRKAASRNEFHLCADLVKKAGLVEAWHAPAKVRELNDIRDGHDAGIAVDVFDLPILESHKFEVVTDMLRGHGGNSYWFKGILYARFNSFRRKTAPDDEWFCSHIIEHHLRCVEHPTTDLRVPAHGVWPGSLGESVRTCYLGNITI